MNQKTYSVLFCALLASTFVHELRAKGAVPVSSRLEVFERAASTEICELKCSFNETTTVSFGLTIQVVEDVLVIANLSTNAALLIDASARILVLLNGATGEGVAIDVAAQSGVYIKSGLWVASKTSIEVFIKSLSGGLKAILSISGAVTFKVSSVSSAILVVINQIIIKLVANVQDELKQDAKLGIQILLAIGGGIIGLLNGVLKGILGIVGSVAIHITNDIAGLLNVLQGLALIVEKVAGSFAALIEKGVSLDLAIILGAASGLEVLINIILQIGAVIDIGAALGEILNNAENLFKLIAQLGGNISVGINGVFLVVSEILALISGNATLEVVISTIIQVVALSSQHVSFDVTSALNATLEGLLTTIKHLGASSTLSGLVSIVEALIGGKFIVGGVNISIIIEKLLAGAISGTSSLLQVVAYVVLQLQAAVEAARLVPYLLLVLIFKLNSAIGIKQLIALGIKIEINVASKTGSILKHILSGVVSLVLGLANGNFYKALTKLPVIGRIIVALNAAVEAASSGKLSLKSLLNSASLVKNLILGLIQLATGIYLGISSAVIAQVKAMLEATSSFSTCMRVNVTTSAGVSISG